DPWPHPGRLGRGVRRVGRVRGAGDPDERGLPPPTPRRPRHLRGPGRDDPAGTRSAVFTHVADADVAPTRPGRSAHPRSPDRLGHRRRRGAPRVRGGGAAMTAEHVDVLLIGAGLSGIGAAAHLTRTLPRTSYVVLEARE